MSQDTNPVRFPTYMWPSTAPSETALVSELAPSDGNRMHTKKCNLKKFSYVKEK